MNQSGKTLEDIVGSVKRVTEIVSEIASASSEQLVGVEQVNKAVSQMDRVTQNNASQTEEMNGTAASLLQHAQQLGNAVSRFALGGDNMHQNVGPGQHYGAAPQYQQPSASLTQQNSFQPRNAGVMAEQVLDQVTGQIDQATQNRFVEF